MTQSTQTVKLENTNNSKLPSNDNTNKKLIWKTIGKVFLLVWTILCLARVPFVGSYVDGLFDYILGQGKYLFYLLAVIVQIALLFNLSLARIARSKRFVFFALLGLLSVCCMISGINDLVKFFKTQPSFVDLMNNYHSSWVSYFVNWHYSGYFNFTISGGILAVLISYVFNFLSYLFLVIVAGVILVISIFIICNINYKSTRVGLKVRGWMVRKLGGTFKYDTFNELKEDKDNQNKFKKVSRGDIETIAKESDSLAVELLPSTDVNCYAQNFKRANHIQNRLATLFKTNKVDCVPTDINIYTSYSEVCFETKGKSDVNEIISLQPQIAKQAKLDHFNISYRGNIVAIEFENNFFSKISLKAACSHYKTGKDVTAVFAFDKDNKLITQDFRNNPSALIVGKKGSGGATLAVLMALSTCFITGPKKLELVVLNPNCEATFSHFNALPHTNGKIYDSVNACTDKLHELQELINNRSSALKLNNVSNIDQYNSTITSTTVEPFKHILVVIANFDSIIRETFQNNKIISDLLVYGPQVGVYVVLQSYVVNNDVMESNIYNNISDKYVLSLTDQDESVKIFDNYRGCQLHGNGDCLHFCTRLSSLQRIQVCNINYAELTSDIDTIKLFWEVKQEQRDKQLLEGNKDETSSN